LQGWHCGANLSYEAIASDDRGWLWCESLGLWLGTWKGTILKETATWLRFYSRDGNLILLGDELAEQEKQRAEQEKQRAKQEKQRAERAESELLQLRGKRSYAVRLIASNKWGSIQIPFPNCIK
jgi:hypothetical protein